MIFTHILTLKYTDTPEFNEKSGEFIKQMQIKFLIIASVNKLKWKWSILFSNLVYIGLLVMFKSLLAKFL